MALEPSLWGTLPNELLHLVFARLSIVGIVQLRVLSKEWKKHIDCKDSEFHQVLDATVQLNMFFLLSSSRIHDFVSIYDVQTNKWHGYHATTFLSLVGADGGLICYDSQWPSHCKFFIVVNPLTKQRRKLPPLLSMGTQKITTLKTLILKMVKFSVDRKTKEYKVFVVGSIENGGQGFFAQVYDSHIKEWMVVEATHSHIIGWDYLVFHYNIIFNRSLYVYNCANGTLDTFEETNIVPGLEVEPGCCALIENHLFVLHKEASLGPKDLLSEDGESILPKYCISEFHLPEKTTTWMKLGVRSCEIGTKCFHDSRHNLINLGLWGCNGFLLVYGDGSKYSSLYNLSTCEWRTLPAFKEPLYSIRMCSISWNAIV